MSEQTANAEQNKVVATSTLEDALRALKISDQTVMILSGFRAMVPKQDVLGPGWSSC